MNYLYRFSKMEQELKAEGYEEKIANLMLLGFILGSLSANDEIYSIIHNKNTSASEKAEELTDFSDMLLGLRNELIGELNEKTLKDR